MDQVSSELFGSNGQHFSFHPSLAFEVLRILESVLDSLHCAGHHVPIWNSRCPANRTTCLISSPEGPVQSPATVVLKCSNNESYRTAYMRFEVPFE